MSIFDGIKKAAGNVGRKGKIFWLKHGDKVCLIGGIGCVLGGTALACYATLKVPDVIEDRNEKIAEIKEQFKLPEIPDFDILGDDDEAHTEIEERTALGYKEEKREIVKVHAMTALEIAKDYIPAVLVMGCGIFLLTKSHSIVTKKYLALTAAYGALQTEFNEYRKCVIKEYGEEVDQKFIFGIEQKTLTFTDPETGEEKTEEKEVCDLSKFGKTSMNATFLFDERSPYWEKSGRMNKGVIDMVIFSANQELVAMGRKDPNAIYLMNDILKNLGLEMTQAGGLLGWKYDPDRGDSQITYDIVSGLADDGDFVLDPDERNMWIRLNVDGNVLVTL